MVRRQLLFIGLSLLAGLTVHVSVMSDSSAPRGCDASDIVGHGCRAAGNSDRTGVNLFTSETSRGSAASGGRSRPARRDPNIPDENGNCAPTVLPAACEVFIVVMPGQPHGGVTLSDLKHFKPRPGTDHMQPNGWAIIGLDTNFFATVPSELEHGQLLGQPAEVRFFPLAWHWRYGDGAQATVGTPGATWAAHGLSDFDKTATSHVYRTKGSYAIDLDILFGAEYRYAGSDWVPVEGTIDVPAKRLRVTVGDARTVLVNHDCLANPHGPGC
jgi:hypothetical protein